MEQKVFHRKYEEFRWKKISSGHCRRNKRLVALISNSVYVKRSGKRYIGNLWYIENLGDKKGNEDENDNDVRIRMRTCQRYVHIAGGIVAFPPIIQFGRRQFALTGGSVGVNFSQSIPLLHARSAVTWTRENPRAWAHNWKTAAEIDRGSRNASDGIAKRADLIGSEFAEKSILGRDINFQGKRIRVTN